jgi:hypothetical protein
MVQVNLALACLSTDIATNMGVIHDYMKLSDETENLGSKMYDLLNNRHPCKSDPPARGSPRAREWDEHDNYSLAYVADMFRDQDVANAKITSLLRLKMNSMNEMKLLNSLMLYTNSYKLHMLQIAERAQGQYNPPGFALSMMMTNLAAEEIFKVKSKMRENNILSEDYQPMINTLMQSVMTLSARNATTRPEIPALSADHIEFKTKEWVRTATQRLNRAKKGGPSGRPPKQPAVAVAVPVPVTLNDSDDELVVSSDETPATPESTSRVGPTLTSTVRRGLRFDKPSPGGNVSFPALDCSDTGASSEADGFSQMLDLLPSGIEDIQGKTLKDIVLTKFLTNFYQKTWGICFNFKTMFIEMDDEDEDDTLPAQSPYASPHKVGESILGQTVRGRVNDRANRKGVTPPPRRMN